MDEPPPPYKNDFSAGYSQPNNPGYPAQNYATNYGPPPGQPPMGGNPVPPPGQPAYPLPNQGYGQPPPARNTTTTTTTTIIGQPAQTVVLGGNCPRCGVRRKIYRHISIMNMFLNKINRLES